MDEATILDPLNEAQRDAVTSDSGNMLVLAGAGSGKTRVLVHRIAWLIRAQGYSPGSILAVTFTNKAAREMRARIEEILQTGTRGMWVGTFHGLAHRLLQTHWEDAGLPRNFQILDAADQQRLVKRVCRELQLEESRWPPRQAQGYINSCKDEGLRPAHLPPPASGDLYQKTMQRIYTTYQAACERSGLVDFAELLLRAHELWLKNPQLLQHYQQRFRYILVDEFQDTNTIQYAWLTVLAGAEGDQIPVMAVGDDDQSIYGWRGAKIENIQRFPMEFSDTRTVRLEQNYRSTATILEAANAVISHNQSRLGKELWTDSGGGDAISLYAAYNERDEARFIVERLQEWAMDGNDYRSAAILYRANAQSRVLEDALLQSGVPYRVLGGLRFYERSEIKNALAYLRLLLSPDDDAALERVINLPPRGIGGRTMETLRELAQQHQLSLWQALARALQQTELPGRTRQALKGFSDCLETLRETLATLPLDQQIERVIEGSGLLEMHRNERGEQGQTRLENLAELVTASQQFQPQEPELSPLQEFLDNASLDAGEAQAGEHEDYVQLMTLHSAKGLEFPLVFLSGMEENLFPHYQSANEPGRLEEERRLCYVGITRAMRQLVISYAETRQIYNRESYNRPSRFLGEIPVELMQEVNGSGNLAYSAIRAAGASSPAPEQPAVELGQRVRHQLFGEGVVVHCEGRGDSTRVEVNFDREGSKWLVWEYAKKSLI